MKHSNNAAFSTQPAKLQIFFEPQSRQVRQEIRIEQNNLRALCAFCGFS
jgi:hypothetical protein